MEGHVNCVVRFNFDSPSYFLIRINALRLYRDIRCLSMFQDSNSEPTIFLIFVEFFFLLNLFAKNKN